MSDVSQYIPTKEFLTLLGGKLKRTRLRQMLQEGRLDAIRPGGSNGRWFINRAEAERLLQRVGERK